MHADAAIPRTFEAHDGLTLDVAVVGAGIAGLYAAWRLAGGEFSAPGGGPPRIAIFEATERIGGRIETATFPGMRRHRAEFGAMRIASWQRHVLMLLEELGLGVEPFPMGDEHNFWYLRGRRLHAADLADPSKIPYFLEGWEVGKTPHELLAHVARQLLGGVALPADRRAWDELKRGLRYRGRPAREFGFWNVLSDHLSPDAVHFVEDSVGYGSLTQNWNAVEALQLVYSELQEGVEFLRIAGGTDRLPAALARRFTQTGRQIFCGNAVTRIDADPETSGGTVLTVTSRVSGDTWQVQAKRLILALPRRALELLGQHGSLFEPFPLADPDLLELVGSVHRFPAFKLFLAYEEPWWLQLGIASGGSVTDMPIRQTYYFGVEEDQRALLMASYDDDRAVGYWQGLGWTGRDEARAPRLEVQGEGGPSEIFVAPPEMVRHAQSQLARMHGIDLPPPYMAAYRNWGAAPYGGGWHLWRVNADSVAIGKRMRRPLPDHNIHACGEAYSGIQGFIEGALTTAELVLQEQFGLSRPAWLADDYYLGE